MKIKEILQDVVIQDRITELLKNEKRGYGGIREMVANLGWIGYEQGEFDD